MISDTESEDNEGTAPTQGVTAPLASPMTATFRPSQPAPCLRNCPRAMLQLERQLKRSRDERERGNVAA